MGEKAKGKSEKKPRRPGLADSPNIRKKRGVKKGKKIFPCALTFLRKKKPTRL